MRASVITSGASAPVLRWIYARGSDRLFCELSQMADHSIYELRIDHLTIGRRSRVEQFADVIPAFIRHEHIEAQLIADGWSLEFYEKRLPTLH
jgi:hypothetical protein